MIAIAMKADNYKFADIAMVLMAVTAIYKIGLMLIVAVLLLCNFNHRLYIMGYVRFLFYLGLIINIVFVGLLILLMFSNHIFWIIEKIVLEILLRLHIVKNKEKFRAKIIEQKQKYSQCAEFFKVNPIVVIKMFVTLILTKTCSVCCDLFCL